MAAPKAGVKSDGSSTGYYKIPAGATDLIDLIEHKRMDFGIGNIFKACYRLGEKDGIDPEYDLRKIVFFAQRKLDEIEKRKATVAGPFSPIDDMERLKRADALARPPMCEVCHRPLTSAHCEH